MNAASSLLVSLAMIALAVFFFTPNRYLNAGHWGVALMLVAFVNSSLWDQARYDAWFWLPLLGGVGLFTYWFVRRLVRSDASAGTCLSGQCRSSESEADHGQ